MIRRLICVLVLTPSLAFAQGASRPVLDKKTIAERTNKFELKMRRLGFSGRIQSCDHMMQVAVGTRGGDISYGAVCRIAVNGETQSVMLCDDDLVGHFGLKGLTFAYSDVAEFATKNCSGG